MTFRLLPLALACVACSPAADPASPGEEAAAQPSGAQCDVTDLQQLVGRQGDPATVEEARKRSGSRTVRRYETGSALTMDFRPDRLNVEVDPSGRIVKLGCG